MSGRSAGIEHTVVFERELVKRSDMMAVTVLTDRDNFQPSFRENKDAVLPIQCDEVFEFGFHRRMGFRIGIGFVCVDETVGFGDEILKAVPAFIQ